MAYAPAGSFPATALIASPSTLRSTSIAPTAIRVPSTLTAVLDRVVCVVTIGAGVIIEKDVTIGDNVTIEDGVVIPKGTVILDGTDVTA